MSKKSRPRFELPQIAHEWPMSDEVRRQLIQAEIEINQLIADAASAGYEFGLIVAAGPVWGPVLLALTKNQEGRSNAEIAREMGLTRAAVSKRDVQLRKNLGLPARVPNNARPGMSTGGQMPVADSTKPKASR